MPTNGKLEITADGEDAVKLVTALYNAGKTVSYSHKAEGAEILTLLEALNDTTSGQTTETKPVVKSKSDEATTSDFTKKDKKPKKVKRPKKVRKGKAYRRLTKKDKKKLKKLAKAGYTIPEVVEETGIKYSTIYSWASRENITFVKTE